MKTLIAIACALLLPLGAIGARQPEYYSSFNPTKGFKSAQRDLTEVFLQLAGSLEEYGSPVPYLQHVANEHARIEKLYLQKLGKVPTSFRPVYMDDAYLEKLAANWKLLSPKVGLEPYAREFGHFMRDAIKGTRGNGTIAVEIFNNHQNRIVDEMAGKGDNGDFETLRSELVTRLELDTTTVDTGGYSLAQRDAVRYGLILHDETLKLFKQIDAKLKPGAAELVKDAISSVMIDVGRMANSELKAGLLEWSLASGTAKK